jgi:BolA protein
VSVKSRIEEALRAALTPESLSVVDESHMHAGHAGARPGGETHFRVRIVAAAFAGKGRVERHRMVNTVLRDELAGQVHALAVEAAAPGEAVPG